MLSSLNLPLLQSRRTQAKLKLSTFYKIINGLLIVPTNDLAPKISSLRNGYCNQPMTLIDAYKYSFFPAMINLWNQLPADVINSLILNQFCNNLIFMITPVRYNLDCCTVINIIIVKCVTPFKKGRLVKYTIHS